ncbi:MAG: AI-2E family transporter [Bacteriovorax sp.]
MSEINADTFRRNFLRILVAAAILVGFFYILTPFYIPILLGGILAMAFSPFVHYFTGRGWSRKVSLIVMTFILFLMGLAPVSVVLMRGTKVVSHFLSEKSLLEIKHNLEVMIYKFLDHFSEKSNIDPTAVREKFDSFMNSSGSYALNLLSSFLSQVPDILMLSFTTILSFYFFLLEEEKIRRWFDQYFYFSKENGDRFIYLVKASCKEIFFSNVITGITQATVIAAGAFFCKTGDFFIIFVITFFLSFIPTGAAPVGFLLGVFAFIDHRVGAGIAMCSVSAFSGIIDNIIRPYLNSLGSVEVPVFVNFLSIIGGVLMMGLAGLFVGPLLSSLIYGILPIFLDEWFPQKNNRE